MLGNARALRILCPLVGAVLLSAVSPSNAQTADIPSFVTGNELAQWFTNRPNIANAYVLGVWDQHSSFQVGLGQKTICMPTQVSRKQAAEVVKRYVNEHPEQRHYAAAAMVTVALTAAFPCPK